jgi:curved DNA-binding protein CbpA
VVPTYYELLGIPDGASDEEIRHAYRRLVKGAHPDRAGDTAQFRLLTQAYEVLSDPASRAAYDRSLRPAPVAAPPAPAALPPRRPRRYGRYVVLLIAALVLGGVTFLAVATTRQSVGDECLVGTWRSEAFEIPFRGVLDGREVDAPVRGGAGAMLAVAADGTVRADYTEAAPFTGADGLYRIEGAYRGTTRERWRAAGGRVEQTGTDTSDLTFRATIAGRAPDRPLAVTVLDREYPYTCTATTLELGPYRYIRI